MCLHLLLSLVLAVIGVETAGLSPRVGVLEGIVDHIRKADDSGSDVLTAGKGLVVDGSDWPSGRSWHLTYLLLVYLGFASLWLIEKHRGFEIMVARTAFPFAAAILLASLILRVDGEYFAEQFASAGMIDGIFGMDDVLGLLNIVLSLNVTQEDATSLLVWGTPFQFLFRVFAMREIEIALHAAPLLRRLVGAILIYFGIRLFYSTSARHDDKRAPPVSVKTGGKWRLVVMMVVLELSDFGTSLDASIAKVGEVTDRGAIYETSAFAIMAIRSLVMGLVNESQLTSLKPIIQVVSVFLVYAGLEVLCDLPPVPAEVKVAIVVFLFIHALYTKYGDIGRKKLCHATRAYHATPCCGDMGSVEENQEIAQELKSKGDGIVQSPIYDSNGLGGQ